MYIKNGWLDAVKYYFTKPEGFVKMLGVEWQSHSVVPQNQYRIFQDLV